jgi:signal transduction histidine kinase
VANERCAGRDLAIVERPAPPAAARELTEQYCEALREYCAQGGHSALSWAFHLGYQAASDGLGLLDIAAMHEKALVAALAGLRGIEETTFLAHRASQFLAEALVPFEQKHRRCEDEHSTLRDLNEGLEQWLNAAQHKLEAVQELLLEQRRAERRKDEFVCAMNHVTHGSLSVLQSGIGGELNAHGQRLLDTALRNSERVSHLVGDVSDVPRPPGA